MGAHPILAAIPKVPLADYLMQEDGNTVRHEYHAGVVTMMAGGTAEHARAIANFSRELGISAKGCDCGVYSGDLSIWIAPAETSIYPDLSLFCSPLIFHQGSRRLATNPVLVVEVLSPSTRDYDLSAKFLLYQQLERLGEYICLEPSRVEVHYWAKEADGQWRRERFADLADEIPVRALGKSLKLSEIYEGLA